jgi:hypothetical protein
LEYEGHNDDFIFAYDYISLMSDEEYELLLEQSDEVGIFMWPLTKELGDKWGDKQIKAWDWFRIIHLVGWAYIAEMIDREEAYFLMEPAIMLLRNTFSSWDEAVENYMDGYAWWSNTDVMEELSEYRHRLGIYEAFRYDKILFNPTVWTSNFVPSPTSGFTFVNTGDGTCSVTGYIGEAHGDLVIPSEIEGLIVTGIGDLIESGSYWFTDFEDFTGTLTLPDSLITIGFLAFYNSDFSGLVTIPEGVTTIGESAFAQCMNITGVILPESLDTIGQSAFRMCIMLTEAEFLGDAPTVFQSGVFNEVSDDFRIIFNPDKSGWTTPEWNGYPSFPR